MVAKQPLTWSEHIPQNAQNAQNGQNGQTVRPRASPNPKSVRIGLFAERSAPPKSAKMGQNGQNGENGQNDHFCKLVPKSAHPSFPNSFGPKMTTGPILGLSEMAKMAKMVKIDQNGQNARNGPK